MAHFTRTHPNGVWQDVPAPTISGISPPSGGFNTTNVFVITGTNLQFTTAVDAFVGGGGAPANGFTGFVVDSPTQITVTTGSLNPPGFIDVRVTTDTGQVTETNGYEYV